MTDESSDLLGENKIIIYPWRWVVLASFSLMSASNAIVWNSFSPIARTVISYFETPSVYIDALSFVWMFVYIPLVFPASWMINKYGIAIGVMTGAVLSASGAWVRYVGFLVPLTKMQQYYIVFAGQTLSGIGQCFILQIPPLIADNWFPSNQRALATSIGALWNQLGIAIAFLLGPMIVGHDGSKLLLLQLVVAIIHSVTLAFLLFGFRSHPPTPPSVSKEQQQMNVQSFSLVKELKEAFSNRHFVLLFFAYGIDIGVFYAITTLLDQLVTPFGYTSEDTGWFGFIIVVVGLVGAIFGGWILDKTGRYKELLVGSYAGVVFTMIWFSFSLRPNFIYMLGASCAAVGFMITAILPLSLETSLEVTYPKVSGELSSALMMNSAQIFGIISILSMNPLMGIKWFHEATVLLTALAAIAVFLLFFFHPVYQRVKLEIVPSTELQQPVQTKILE